MQIFDINIHSPAHWFYKKQMWASLVERVVFEDYHIVHKRGHERVSQNMAEANSEIESKLAICWGHFNKDLHALRRSSLCYAHL